MNRPPRASQGPRAPDDIRRADARHVPGRARPDDRLDRAAHDRRRPRRPRPPLLGRHLVSARLDDLDADLRQARRHVGRKPVFLAAILIFLAGSMLAGLSQSMGELIGFRALQGIGAGGLMVGAQAIIADIVPPRERGRYMGLIGSVFAVASVAGPLLGGFLVDSLSWRWVFYVNMPIGALAILIVDDPAAPATRRACATSIDYLGAALLTGGVGSLILLTTWGGNEYAWGSTTIVGLGIVGVALLAAFVWWERAPPSRSCRSGCSARASSASRTRWASRSAWRCSARSSSSRCTCSSSTAPARPSSGLRLLPLMAGLLVAVDRLRAGRSAASAATRRFRSPARRSSSSACTCSRGSASARRPGSPRVYMLVVGVGIGLVMQVLVLVVQNDVRPQDIGVATSTATFFRSVGGSFGVAIFGTIFASRLASQLAAAAQRRHGASRQRRAPQPRAGEAAPAGRPRRLPQRVRALAPRRLPVGNGDGDRSRSCSPGCSRKCRCGRRSGRPPRRRRRPRQRNAGRAWAGDGCETVARSRLESERVERLRARRDDHALRLQVVVERLEPELPTEPDCL